MQSNARFISIFLAILVPVAAWIGIEYVSQLDVEKGRSGSSAAQVSSVTQDYSPNTVQNQPHAPASVTETEATERPSPIRKCSVEGKISYSDHECQGGTEIKTLAAEPPTGGRMRTYQEQLDNTVRNRPPAMVNPAPHSEERIVLAAASQSDQCRNIDEQIANIDAQLRAPHSASWGDYWNQQKRKLNGEKFSLGC